MAAGHDTSANILSWSVYIMATKQDLQDKLRAEMFRELGDESEPTYSQIEALPFLDNFLRETLRVYASGKSIPLSQSTFKSFEQLRYLLLCRLC